MLVFIMDSLRVKMSKVNYISVPFKGNTFMCVEGSKRADVLNRANRAWVMGYDDLCRDLFNEATTASGCAFAHRESLREQ